MKEKPEPHTENRREGNTGKKEAGDDKNLFLFIGIITAIILIIAGIAWWSIDHQQPETLDDLFEEFSEKGGDAIEVDTLMYNNFQFIKYDGLWYTRVRSGDVEYEVPLHFNPREVESVEVLGSINSFFVRSHTDWGGRSFITFDPDEEDLSHTALANGELSLNIIKAIDMRIFPACTKNITGICQTVPTVDCDSPQAVIYLKQDETDRVTVDDNCLIIQGTEMGLTRAVDRVLYSIYGIMP